MRAPMRPLLLLLTACASQPEPPATEPAAPVQGPMDHHPGRRTLSPGGSWEVVVAPGGQLSVAPAAGGEPILLDQHVDARVAVSADEQWLVYARQGTTPDTDLWRVALPGGSPQQLTAWRGSEDRPVLSPDGQRLAFVSGHTGIASWWLVDLDGALPVPVERARQLSNLGVEDQPRSPGQPPAGWVPVPEGHDYAWTDAGLRWVARGQEHRLQPHELQP